MKLIVGLGNPGKEYESTRHNIGFMVVDALVRDLNITFSREKFKGNYVETTIYDEKVIILKPLKYINLSGEVIRDYINFYKINIEDILIIHDDLDLEVGSLRLKPSGTSAGHNGLKNIEVNLGTIDYKRLKIGISNNKEIDTKDYVLGKISKEESLIFEEMIKTSQKIIIDFIKLDFNSLMNKYNHR